MQPIRNISLLLFFLTSIGVSEPIIKPPTTKGATTFAVIVDAKTYETIGASVDAYRASIEADGLPAYLVVDAWKSPDEIKAVITKLYGDKHPLEGFALVGDIPIPMIRDAQHMTSAFKMDAEAVWTRSSVPSDRFYDDLHLKFTFLKHDTTHTLYYYYSLDAASPQRVERELYSGRIKAPVDTPEKYEMLSKYLQRIVRQKKESQVLDHAMMFTGHGYHSEALSSWEGNTLAMKELFPTLYAPGGTLENLNYAMDHEMKAMLLQKLQNPELDLAIFHAHGEVDAQLIVGEPPTFMVDHNIQAIKRFVRNKMRAAKRRKKSVDEALTYYLEQYKLPKEWFADTFTDSVTAVDSIEDAKEDIHSSDIARIATQPRFVMFDECFNGSFHENGYIAGTYVFGNGNTVAAAGNTVNILQDIWANDQIGLLGLGVRIGAWHRFRNTLETHIIGDPTFHFASRSTKDIQTLLSTKRHDRNVWRPFLKNDDPVLRTLGVAMVFANEGKAFDKELLSIFKTDGSFNVRLEALKCLAALRTPSFEQAVIRAADDPYELIRRKAIMWMGEIGKPEFAPAIAKAAMNDPSERVKYSAHNSMEKLGMEAMTAPVRSYASCVADGSEKSSFLSSFTRSVSYYHSRLDSELVPMCLNDTLSVKKRVQTLRTFRLYNYEDAVPVLVRVAGNTKNPARVRTAALETMGWYSFSSKREEFISLCTKIMADASAPSDVKNEAMKTKARLIEGPNDPIIP